ncbi:Ribokinase-like protein [Sordaria brevicollis]|uniref:Ribokinase-like protein n=1 Tax=Sordaria brevicollis TaxID=83679 RepID=A0AAE0UCJ4_SORBR|nr:Ribokinase-like protein [Sordaria brevicollis]
MADNDNPEMPGQDTNGVDRASDDSSEWQDINDTPPSTSIDFVTLGMFIIDEIEYPPPRPPSTNVLGGAGTYSALGARLFSPAPDLSRTVGWIVDQGSDFPSAITDLINGWSTSAVFRHDPSRLTTRGWNGYVDSSERREFKYTTPKKRLTAADLSGTPLLKAKAVHMVCSPNRCRELVEEIISLRKKEAKLAAASRPTRPTNGEKEDDDDSEDEENDPNAYTRPLIIWEPVPDLCTPFELLNCTNTLPLVDICSPNHAELAGFMGTDGLDPETGQISTEQVERNCEQLLASMPLTTYTLVVRAGERGCYVARNGGGRPRKRKQGKDGKSGKKKKKVGLDARNFHGGLQPDTDMEALFAGLLQDMEDRDNEDDPFGRFDDDEDGVEVDPGIERWLPAYHTDAEMVVDPTGGGNTFLGGLAVALARGKTIEEACAWGSVAASFAIEQVGVPEIGNDEEGRETWNGERVEDRLRGGNEDEDGKT